MSDGEEWRGESESTGFSIFGLNLKPMTPEERVEWDAKAALRHSLLPKYRPHHACVKCGHVKPARTYYDRTTFGANRESLRRECRRCSYVWNEQVLSEEES